MSVTLRLTRMGCKKRPFYRIVAVDSKVRRDGRPLEYLGYYNPMTEPATVSLDREKIERRLAQGADTSETVESLFRQAGFLAAKG